MFEEFDIITLNNDCKSKRNLTPDTRFFLASHQNKKETPTQTTYYTLEGQHIIHTKVVTASLIEDTYYLYDEQGVLVGYTYNDNTYYYERDVLGNIIRIIDKDLKTIVEYKYDAFGNFTKELYTEVVNAVTIEQQNHFYYKGYCLDKETGLYYCNSRYYDPSIGRWISPDDIGYLEYAVIGGCNLYVYCVNNPVMYYDPSGCFAISTLIIGLAVSWAVSSIASHYLGGNLVSGIGLSVGGVQTIGVGISLFAFGPAGWVLGGIAIASGIGSLALATAELQQHFTGNNWMKDAGMSDGWYTGLMIGNAIVGATVSIGGVKYMNSMHGQRAFAYQNIGKYKYTKTVMNHSGKRPYLYDISKQRMVIKNGTMTIDIKMSPSSIFAGGRNYNFAYGDWSLTVSNTYRTIYHFLYAASITGMY